LRRIKQHWSAGLLAIAAVVMLGFGRPTRDALAAAGFAFLGAAVTRLVDIAKEGTDLARAQEARRREDLDDTRRLVYMALVASKTSHPELVATIANALAHHGSGVDAQEAAERVASAIRRGGVAPSDQEWLSAQIQRITAELGE
jgi:hypothetical protein